MIWHIFWLTTFITIVSFIPYFCLLVFGTLVTLVAWFSFHFFRLAHLASQNLNKDYVIFLYFHNFVAKSDQKPKTKSGMNERINNIKAQRNCQFVIWQNFWLTTFITLIQKFCGRQKIFWYSLNITALNEKFSLVIFQTSWLQIVMS